MAPREGLELEWMKMGRTGPPLEPRRRPQAGKSRDPRSQNADRHDDIFMPYEHLTWYRTIKHAFYSKWMLH